MKKTYDIIVVGAGHAGCEAALASARLGQKTLLVSSNVENIAQMSCNPAIGGLGKGHLVREIDALGGEMGKVADATGIQFRRLNASKGAAVRGTRCQSDSELYKRKMQDVLKAQEDLEILEAMVDQVLVQNGEVIGLRLEDQSNITSKAVILTTGTFMNGLIHVGLENKPAGRVGDRPSTKLSESLVKLGLTLGRLKTGTCPRLDGRTIHFEKLEPQAGDDPPPLFSFSGTQVEQTQVPCYLTYTNERTHEIIRSNLHRSPLYSGIIKSTGPRYCPSIEDKIFKFADKTRHHIFLEPEGLSTIRWYPNGLSTSLPLDVQEEMIHSIEGLEDAVIVQPGYGIEYDFFPPQQVYHSLETRKIRGLYLAGQILGTTGYEEAAALGFMAGLNAVLKIRGEEPLVLERGQAYIGVLIDDLVTRGVEVDGRSEPYRMFTSRAEYRLLLREDNADMRLREIGYRLGLVSENDYQKFCEKKAVMTHLHRFLQEKTLSPTPKVNNYLSELGSALLKKPQSLEELLRRPDLKWEDLSEWHPTNFDFSSPVVQGALEQTLIDIHYAGYMTRQEEEIQRRGKIEKMRIPDDFSYHGISGLSREVVEKLSKIKPRSLGQASHIAGVTPAAISILSIYIKQL